MSAPVIKGPEIRDPEIRGWCPGALTPMESGDGLVLRVRPLNGQLSSVQVKAIAQLSDDLGNGILDLTSRGNIQIRGVMQDNHLDVLKGLKRFDLLDASPEAESRRNILVSPFWQAGDVTEALAAQLTEALSQKTAPQVPHKFGFAVDTGRTPVLASASADIRLERSADGRLIVVADGSDAGKAVTVDTAVEQAITLAEWFLQATQTDTRMAKLLAKGVPLPLGHTTPRSNQTYHPKPGVTPNGTLVGVAFGQLPAESLFALRDQGPFRMTPWRMLLIENPHKLGQIKGLITDPQDPRLHITACAGAPRCTQGLLETRPLANALIPHIPKGQALHVSGCTKGCAHPKPADITITGTSHGLSLIRKGRASDTPTHTGLTAAQLIKAI